MAAQDHLIELNEGADSSYSITFALERLCRSDGLASRTKRTYEAMQDVNQRTVKLPRTGTSNKPATDESNTEFDSSVGSYINPPAVAWRAILRLPSLEADL